MAGKELHFVQIKRENSFASRDHKEKEHAESTSVDTLIFEREIESAYEETIALLKTLCAIPAPSHHEERRAEFVKQWFESRGLSAEIDDAKKCAVRLRP